MKNVQFWKKWSVLGKMGWEKKPFLENKYSEMGEITFLQKNQQKFFEGNGFKKWKMCFLEKLREKMGYKMKFFFEKERVKKIIKCEKCAI